MTGLDFKDSSMKLKFKKVKTEHTIMEEFHKILSKIEKNSMIIRMIP